MRTGARDNKEQEEQYHHFDRVDKKTAGDNAGGAPSGSNEYGVLSVSYCMKLLRCDS